MRFRFSLRLFVVFFTLVALVCGRLGTLRLTAKRQADSVAAIQDVGGWVRYGVARGPAWLRDRFDRNCFDEVEFVSLASDYQLLLTLPGVESLEIQGDFSDSDIAVLTKLPSLRKLSLQGTSLTQTGFDQILASPNLNKLEVGGVEDHIEPLRSVGMNGELQHLVAGNCNVGAATIESISLLSDLRTIRLCHNGVDSRIVPILASLPRLRRLDLIDETITGPRIRRLPQEEPFPAIDELLIGRSRLSPEQIWAADPVKVSLNSAGDSTVQSLRPDARLRHLEVREGSFGGPGIEHLASLQNLKTLDLGECQLSIEALRLLASPESIEKVILSLPVPSRWPVNPDPSEEDLLRERTILEAFEELCKQRLRVEVRYNGWMRGPWTAKNIQRQIEADRAAVRHNEQARKRMEELNNSAR